MDKTALRNTIRAKKRAMTEEEIVSRSNALAEKFYASEAYKNAKTIYGYMPYNQEVRTVPMMEQALKDGWGFLHHSTAKSSYDCTRRVISPVRRMTVSRSSRVTTSSPSPS